MAAGGELVKREDAGLLFLPIFRTHLFSADTSVDTRNEFQHRLAISAEIAQDFQRDTALHLNRFLGAINRVFLHPRRGKVRVKYLEDEFSGEFFFLRNTY